MSYSTYVKTSTTGSGSAPTLQFDLFNGGVTGTYEGRLVFDPGLLQTVVDNTWQSWNAGTAGAWYFSPNGHNTLSSDCSIGGAYCTLAQAESFLNGTGFNAVDVLFKAGSGQASFNGDVDDFTIGSTTYDFEPAAVPEPATIAIFGFAAAGLAAARRRRRA